MVVSSAYILSWKILDISIFNIIFLFLNEFTVLKTSSFFFKVLPLNADESINI